jgi:hypothetical protein
MPNPIKVIKSVTKAATRAKTDAIQKSSVKKLPAKTAPKTGLENRGARLTDLQKKNRAADLQWNKAERNFEAQQEMNYTGPKTGKPAWKQNAKNARRDATIDKEAAKKVPIKINSARLKPNRIIKKKAK